MNSKLFDLDFFGLQRKLPVSFLPHTLLIANFNNLGDIELTIINF